MNFIAFADHRDGSFKKSSLEAVTTAVSLAGLVGGSAAAVVVGKDCSGLVDKLSPYGVGSVYVVEDPKLEKYATGAIATAIAAAAEAFGADVVVISHNAHGKDLAPRVAVKLEAGLAPDVVAYELVDGKLLYTRPVYSGKGRAVVEITTPRQVISLRPNVFAPTAVEGGSAATTTPLSVTFGENDFGAIVVESSVSSGKKDVADADIIVSGGRGLRGPENFNLVEDLAEALDGAVGASRAVVDAGWRPHAEQVGQTGKTVSPTLYVACGISGAVQHLAGMSGSKYILAINKDKDSPIFSIADYGIVGDLFEVMPILTQEIRSARN